MKTMLSNIRIKQSRPADNSFCTSEFLSGIRKNCLQFLKCHGFKLNHLIGLNKICKKKKKKNCPGYPACTYLNYNLLSGSTHKDGCLLPDLQAKQSEALRAKKQ